MVHVPIVQIIGVAFVPYRDMAAIRPMRVGVTVVLVASSRHDPSWADHDARYVPGQSLVFRFHKPTKPDGAPAYGTQNYKLTVSIVQRKTVPESSGPRIPVTF